ncbi:hypothetical protein BDN72DRAFT_793389, partial [Pluteus cervinus]
MMRNANQKCNAFQSLIGIYLHSCNTPDIIMQLLSSLGIAISGTTVDDAVTHLSENAEAGMKEAGATHLVSFADDNLDADLKHTTPTLEKPEDTLIHITTGTMIPLQHVTTADLECTQELYKLAEERLSSQIPDASRVQLPDLLRIHPEAEDLVDLDNNSDNTFRAWVFRRDLLEHGPDYFHQFRSQLGKPVVVDAIPISKMKQIPNRALDINPSTVSNSGRAFEEFFIQAGIFE